MTTEENTPDTADSSDSNDQPSDKSELFSHEEPAVPANWKGIDRWLNWIPNEGRKIPIAVHNPQRDWEEQWADGLNPENWTWYQGAEVKSRVYNYGLGFALPNRDEDSDSDCMVLDGDNVVREQDGTYRTHPAFHDLIERANSFADISVSMTGAHILGSAPAGLPDDIKKIEASLPEHPDFPNASIEVYDGGLFVAMSGHHIDGTPDKARNIQPVVDELVERFGNPTTTLAAGDVATTSEDTSDSKVEDVPEWVEDYLEKLADVDVIPISLDDNRIDVQRDAIRDFHDEYESTSRAVKYLNDMSRGRYKRWGHISNDGDGDRSAGLLSYIQKLSRINAQHGDGDLNTTIHYLCHVCREVSETEDKQPRKWAERGESWRRDMLLSALMYFDENQFLRWKRHAYAPNPYAEDSDPSVKYWNRAQATLDQETRRDRSGNPSDLTLSFCYFAVNELGYPPYPTSDEIAELAHKADPSRTVRYYRRVLSSLVNDYRRVRKVRSGNDRRYLPRVHHSPPPSDADEVLLDGVDVSELDREDWPEAKHLHLMADTLADIIEADDDNRADGSQADSV